jgi:flagellar basal-body rod modification protein FlgD
MEVDDANGNEVRRESFGALAAGANTLTWDGLDDSGAVQAPGTYTVQVSATDISGNAVSVTQQSCGLVTGLTFQNGTTQLMIGNTPVSLSDVISIQQASNSQ